MEALAKEKGVQFKYNSPIEEMTMNGDKVKCLRSDKDLYPLDYVVASADYHYVEQQLLPKKYRRYSEAYWSRRVMAPSSLIFYIGLNKRVKKLLHHTLFFDEDFALHANEIYEDPKWPTSPQFYVSCPSQTDDTVAPAGH